jgi:hypothetical protein
MTPRGFETVSATDIEERTLRQSTFRSGAESGAVSTESSTIAPEALAVALLSLSPADRVRLVALLTEPQTGQVRGE